MEFFGGEAADDVKSQCFERWSHSDTYMNAVQKRIVPKPFFIWPVARFMKQHVESKLDECRLTQL